jgi:nucleoside-diphosphate-sugar epimerase
MIRLGQSVASNQIGPPRTDLRVPEQGDKFIISADDPILVTGAAGFIGSCVVEGLLDRGFHRLICFARPSSKLERLQAILARRPAGAEVEVVQGNLLSRQDCEAACKDVALILHLAAGKGEKSYPEAFMNSVVATRNLLEASLVCARLRRFVLVSSFTVYTNRGKPNGKRLDETCPVEERAELRGEAYCFGKVKQEQIVAEYHKKFGIPYVTIRPGAVYGVGKEITGRVGIGTFGIFLHMGGSNTIPFTYMDNCAEAIILAGLIKGIDGEVFNVVDDDLPCSREFLSMYKRNIRRFKSVYLPHAVSYALCFLWEKYSIWSAGQLPPGFNRGRWHANWKKTEYANEKLKALLGWRQKVTTPEAMRRYFQRCKEAERDA